MAAAAGAITPSLAHLQLGRGAAAAAAGGNGGGGASGLSFAARLVALGAGGSAAQTPVRMGEGAAAAAAAWRTPAGSVSSLFGSDSATPHTGGGGGGGGGSTARGGGAGVAGASPAAAWRQSVRSQLLQVRSRLASLVLGRND